MRIIKNYECSILLDVVELFQASLQFYGVGYKPVIRKQMMTLILTRESTNTNFSKCSRGFFFKVCLSISFLNGRKGTD